VAWKPGCLSSVIARKCSAISGRRNMGSLYRFCWRQTSWRPRASHGKPGAHEDTSTWPLQGPPARTHKRSHQKRRSRITNKKAGPYLSSKNPLTIAARIKEGSEQASRLIIEIASDINYKVLIQGLRSGIYKNSSIKEILLIYKRKFYRLPRNLIMSNRIFDILKNEKGYTWSPFQIFVVGG